MDNHCGDVTITGVSLSDKVGQIFETMRATASVQQTKPEPLGLSDTAFGPRHIGAVM